MILLIHDLGAEEAKRLESTYATETVVVSDDGTIRHCVGCFGCWTKDPGSCVIKDKYSDMGALLGACTQLHIVSRCVYGGFSPFVKNVLDRSISYVHPDLRMREGKHTTGFAMIALSGYLCGSMGGITENERNSPKAPKVIASTWVAP